MQQGLTHVYYGYGKGKTTAAIGLALRALGHGKKVVMVQFLKNTLCGEVLELNKIDNITLIRGQSTDNFANSMTKTEVTQTTEIHNRNLAKCISLVDNHECEMLILDEVMDAYQLNMIDKTMLEEFVKNKPPFLELVLTGHIPEEWMLDCADYISEVIKRKHPYDSGICAREGIEY